LVFSQDTGAAGVGTAAEVFHRSPVTSGQRLCFAAVLFPSGNIELEAQEEPGPYSPVLCHVRHNVVYGSFHERTMLQLKMSLCFLPVTPSGRLSQTVHVPDGQELSCHFHHQFIPTYSGAPASALISVAVLFIAPYSGIFTEMVLASFSPPSYTGLAFQSSFLNDSLFTSDLFPPSALVSIKVHMDDQK